MLSTLAQLAPDALNDQLESFLKHAVKFGCVEACIFIVERYKDSSSLHRVKSIISNQCKEAFLSGNFSTAFRILESNFVACSKDSFHYLCALGNLEQVVKFIEKTPPDALLKVIHKQRDEGFGEYRPSQIVCICNHVEIVKLFVEKLNIVDIEAFYLACATGRLDLAQYYLTHQRNDLINGIQLYPDIRFNDPLTAACKYGHLEIVKLLIHHGEDFTFHYQPYFQEACIGCHKDIVCYFLQQEKAELHLRQMTYLNTIVLVV